MLHPAHYCTSAVGITRLAAPKSLFQVYFHQIILSNRPEKYPTIALQEHAAAEYHSVLENAGMQVEERRFRNRLPLAHILFIAKKPLNEAEAAP